MVNCETLLDKVLELLEPFIVLFSITLRLILNKFQDSSCEHIS
jgi:hypothetical protein